MPYKDPDMQRKAKAAYERRAYQERKAKAHHTTEAHHETRSALQVLRSIDMEAWREKQIQEAYARWKAEKRVA